MAVSRVLLEDLAILNATRFREPYVTHSSVVTLFGGEG